jgi:hypothetical protein
MRQRPKGEEHEGEESVGDLSQVITSDFNNIQVQRRQILRKGTLVLYICRGVTVDFDVAFIHLQPRGE